MSEAGSGQPGVVEIALAAVAAVAIAGAILFVVSLTGGTTAPPPEPKPAAEAADAPPKPPVPAVDEQPKQWFLDRAEASGQSVVQCDLLDGTDDLRWWWPDAPPGASFNVAAFGRTLTLAVPKGSTGTALVRADHPVYLPAIQHYEVTWSEGACNADPVSGKRWAEHAGAAEGTATP